MGQFLLNKDQRFKRKALTHASTISLSFLIKWIPKWPKKLSASYHERENKSQRLKNSDLKVESKRKEKAKLEIWNTGAIFQIMKKSNEPEQLVGLLYLLLYWDLYYVCSISHVQKTQIHKQNNGMIKRASHETNSIWPNNSWVMYWVKPWFKSTVTNAKSKGWGHLQKFSISQALSHIFVGAVAGEPGCPPTF